MLALENCPCCGGEAAFNGDADGWTWIECISCHLSSPQKISLMEDCRPILAEAWNRRPPTPTVDERPVPNAPYGYVYEWDCSPGVVHRSFDPAKYNERHPNRTVSVYAAPQASPSTSALTEVATPAASWRVNGEPDPHGTQYDCKRAELTLGKLTDDELANGVFMNADQPMDIARMLARDPAYHPPIVWLTAAKERIRWLSRALLAASTRDNAPRAETANGETP